MSRIPQVDLYKREPAFRANPFPAYACLRDISPTHRVTLPGGRGVWLVTRYDDAVTVLKDERFVKDWTTALPSEEIAQWPSPVLEVLKLLKRHMLYTDPPDHARALVSRAFTPRLIEQVRSRIQALAEALLHQVQGEGKMDLIGDYALPLPVAVITELLGIPVEDRAKFREWVDDAVEWDGTREYLEKISPGMRDFANYLRAMFEVKRKNPEDDLLSMLVRAKETGDRLSEDELLGTVVLLLIGGHETTTSLIGTGMLTLLQHPGQLERLKNDPSLLEPAVEELLRYSSPFEKATERFAREDVAVGDKVIPRGEMVLVVIAAANRDPERFPEPDTLDISREDNKHLAFGKGIHYCLGAPLARVETRIAISTLLRRMPALRLGAPPDSLPWRPGLLFRGLRSLPVEF